MKIKSAIFDMDGTLIDSLMFWDMFWDRLGVIYFNGDKFKPSDSDERIIRVSNLSDAMKLLHRNYSIGNDYVELLEIANTMINEFYSTTVKLKDGVREFLEFCYNNKIKMCIASATASDLISIAIKHCGIEKYFSRVFSCSEIGKGKDSPDIYLMAQKFLGSEIDETVVFEDSYIAIKTACEIGMPTIGIYDKYNLYQDKIKDTVNVYINAEETLMKLIDIIEV